MANLENETNPLQGETPTPVTEGTTSEQSTTSTSSASSSTQPQQGSSSLEQAQNLISDIGQTGNAPAAYDVTPTPSREVTADQTVAGNLNSLLSEGSSYLDQARTAALQTMGARGLTNSAIASSAGELAAINAALPIAQQDAATYSTAARDAELYGQQTALERMRHDFDINMSNLDTAEQEYLLGVQDQYSRGLMELENELVQSNMALEDFYSQEQSVLGSSLNLQENYGQGVQDLVAKATAAINEIYTTEGLTPEQQEEAVNVQHAQLESDLELLKATYESMPAWASVWELTG